MDTSEQAAVSRAAPTVGGTDRFASLRDGDRPRRLSRRRALARWSERLLGIVALSISTILILGTGGLAIHRAVEQFDWETARARVVAVEGSQTPELHFRDSLERWWEVPASPSKDPDHVIEIRYDLSDPRDYTTSGPWPFAVWLLVAAVLLICFGLVPLLVLRNEIAAGRRASRRR